jgi:hypothetical protein
MVVYADDHPDGSGLFDVYSAKNGTNEIYTVDLRAEACECPDHEHRNAQCKHIRRVKLALGIEDVPDGVEIDSMLEKSREKYGADPVSAAQTPASAADNTAPAAVATDGGQLVDAEPEISRHYESPEQGAAVYYRCECGREAMRERDLTGETHRAECSAQGGRR